MFEIQPSTCILSRFATQSFVNPHDNDCGSFTLDFEYTKQELQGKGEAMAEYVQKQFENEFSSYRTMIGYVNAEVVSYNNGLATLDKRLLEERKKKADSFFFISNGLFILVFFARGFMDSNKSIEIINFVLDVILCVVSFVLNIGLFSAKYKTPIVGKIGLPFATLCFAAFTYFAFLMPENGLPPGLFG